MISLPKSSFFISFFLKAFSLHMRISSGLSVWGTIMVAFRFVIIADLRKIRLLGWRFFICI